MAVMVQQMNEPPGAEGRFRGIPPITAPEYLRPPANAYKPETDRDYVMAEAMDSLVTNRLINRISGSGEAEMTLLGIAPSDQYFAKALASQYRYRKARYEEGEGSFVQLMAPFKMGMRFSISDDRLDDTDLSVSCGAKVFYRRFPTFEEQKEHGSREDQREDELEMAKGEQEVLTDGGGQTQEQALVRIYEGIDIGGVVGSVSGSDLRDPEGGLRTVTIDLGERFDEAKQQMADDPQAIRRPAEGIPYYERENLAEGVMKSESLFGEWVNSKYTNEILEPAWQAKVEITPVLQDDGTVFIEVAVVNTYAENYPDDVPTDYPPDDWQSFLYDVSLALTTDADAIVDRESTEIEDEYRYDGGIRADGINCAVSEQLLESDRVRLSADAVPVYRQPKYLSRDAVEVGFEELTKTDGLASLEVVADEMQRALEQYQEFRHEALDGKSKVAASRYDKMLRQFEREQERFRNGMEIISENGDVGLAFRLMNRCFANLGFDHWRLFQIIFIIMNIPDIYAQSSSGDAVRNELGRAEVLYFPTGGGKTEAYTGLVVFAAFFDRIRGKEFGTTALTKFPLRLLSLQQLQRIADVMAQAEVIRRDEQIDGDPFSLGYFVGQRNTPNELVPGSKNLVRRVNEDEEFAKDLLVLSRCPFCGDESVSIDGLEDRLRIVHRCSNPECVEVQHQGGDSAILPIHITDREVYRYAPTFVISTIDKIAIVGHQRRFRTLFGRVKNRCPVHGHTSESRCLVDDSGLPAGIRCGEETLEAVCPVDPPSIIVQDELHLLREEFGTFDSHYETFLQEWVNQISDGEWEMKFITATATIEGAEGQVRSLYWKDANVFPSQGPRLRQSFYAYEHPTRLGRRMIGVMPRTKSRTYAMNHITKERARVIQELKSDLNEFSRSLTNQVRRKEDDSSVEAEFSDQELISLIRSYKIQVSYNIAKRTGDLMSRTIRTMVNRQLESMGEPYEPLRTVMMTGETPMNEVRDILSQLESPEMGDSIDVVLATSMISHGVDIDRLNFISFFGMPRNTARYIQSYSRVGRSTPGTVAVMFNPAFARDRSHFMRFQHYHRYQDLLVEATPLERWAEFALDATFPGIFAAIILQLYDEQLEGESHSRVYLYDGLVDAIRAREIQRDDMLQIIRRSYVVDDNQSEPWSDQAGLTIYQQQIEALFADMWDRIQDVPDGPEPNFLTDLMQREDSDRGPMRSLRDIDKQIEILPKRQSSDLMDLLSGGM
jgi:hypothetical protein